MSLSIKINTLIKTFRSGIAAESATAQAIDSNAPRRLILVCAKRDGFTDFAAELENLIQGRAVPHLKSARPENGTADATHGSSEPKPLTGVPAHHH